MVAAFLLLLMSVHVFILVLRFSIFFVVFLLLLYFGQVLELCGRLLWHFFFLSFVRSFLWKFSALFSVHETRF